MPDLIYPIDSEAPILPPASTSSPSGKKVHDPSDEYLPVILPSGIVIGRAARRYCHSGSHALHPVVHLHIISRNEKLYLQKRSMKKDLLPGKWDTAVGGHVLYGESIIEALYRESQEELNFSEFNPIFLGSYQWNTDRDSEMVNIFAAVGSYPSLKPDREEVEEGRWWTFSHIEEKLDSDIFTPNFVSEFKEIKNSLLALL